MKKPSYSSYPGTQWADHNLDRVKLPVTKLVLSTVAKSFNRCGVGNPSTAQIIERGGGGLSRGQVLREISRIEACGLWKVTNRRAGRGKTLIFTASDWETVLPESREEKDSRTNTFAHRAEGEKDSRTNTLAPEKDSRTNTLAPEKDSTESDSFKVREDYRRKNIEVAACAAAPASPTPPPLPLFGDLPGANTPPSTLPSASTSPTPQAMVAAWNAAVADTPLPQAILSGKRAGLLARAARHPAIGTLETWEALCRAMAGDEFHRGERPGGFPATIDQATNPGTIERMTAKMNAPSPPRDWSDVPASEFGPEDVPTGEPPVDDDEMGRMFNPFADLGATWDEHLVTVRESIMHSRAAERGSGDAMQEHHAPAAE